VITKLVAAVRVLTLMSPAAVAVLQVTVSFVPRVSSRVRTITLLAVTEVVATVTVVAAAAMETEPLDADPHVPAELAQFVSVSWRSAFMIPLLLQAEVPASTTPAALRQRVVS
jgi:hypothetical protein